MVRPRESVRAYEEKQPPAEATFCVSTRASELTFVLAGELEVQVGASRRPVFARAGEGLVVLRGTPHRSRSKPGTRLVIVDVPDVPCDGLGVVPLPESAMSLAFERLVPGLWDQRSPAQPGAIDSAAGGLFAPSAFRHLVPIDAGHTMARMLSVKSHLEAHYREPVCLDDVARHFGMDRFYLVRNYTRNFALSPLAYVQALRVEHFVWSLLDDSEPGSLVALAHDAGFGDYATFCRRIRKRFGRAPSELVARTAS